MPDYRQVPTASMGLGPLMAIDQVSPSTPTLSETIAMGAMGAEAFEGTITDLSMPTKKA